jgi:hypothetical protein
VNADRMEPVHVPTLNVRFVGGVVARFGSVTFAMSTTITRLLSVTKRHRPIQHPLFAWGPHAILSMG